MPTQRASLNDERGALTSAAATDSSSAFGITSIVRTNNDIRVTWMTGDGRTNLLQAAPGDANGNHDTNGFADILEVTNMVGTTTNYLDTGALTNALTPYYRGRLVP